MDELRGTREDPPHRQDLSPSAGPPPRLAATKRQQCMNAGMRPAGVGKATGAAAELGHRQRHRHVGGFVDGFSRLSGRKSSFSEALKVAEARADRAEAMADRAQQALDQERKRADGLQQRLDIALQVTHELRRADRSPCPRPAGAAQGSVAEGVTTERRGSLARRSSPTSSTDTFRPTTPANSDMRSRVSFCQPSSRWLT